MAFLLETTLLMEKLPTMDATTTKIEYEKLMETWHDTCELLEMDMDVNGKNYLYNLITSEDCLNELKTIKNNIKNPTITKTKCFIHGNLDTPDGEYFDIMYQLDFANHHIHDENSGKTYVYSYVTTRPEIVKTVKFLDSKNAKMVKMDLDVTLLHNGPTTQVDVGHRITSELFTKKSKGSLVLILRGEYTGRIVTPLHSLKHVAPQKPRQ